MTIKEAAQRTGISVDNLRYYERIGLVPEVPRTQSGIRNYDEMAISWIEFAMRFKKAGVSLEAIREYIQLALQGLSTKDARLEILLETKAELEKKLKDIHDTLDVVNYKIDTYEQKCESVTNELITSWKASKEKK